MFTPLETERLRLRALAKEDVPTVAAYRSEPEVARYQSWDAPYPEEAAAAMIERLGQIVPGQSGRWFQIGLELRESGILIGDCAFCIGNDDPRQAEIGFTLASRFQGQGYATEAITALLRHLFEDRGLHRIHATCDVENLASARLLRRVGMRCEAHFVENAWFKGHWSSEYWFAMLRSEWAG